MEQDQEAETMLILHSILDAAVIFLEGMVRWRKECPLSLFEIIVEVRASEIGTQLGELGIGTDDGSCTTQTM